MAVRGVRRFAALCLLSLLGLLLSAQTALAGAGRSQGRGEQTPLHLPPATHPANHVVSSPTISGGSLLRTFIVLLLVVALIYGLARLARRFNPSRFPKPASNGEIDVLATQALHQGRLLHVVRVGEKVILLGSTEHSVSRLATLSDDDVESLNAPAHVRDTSPAPSFRGALAGAVSSRTPTRHAEAEPPAAGREKRGLLERLKDLTAR